jgi:hypothetical protein
MYTKTPTTREPFVERVDRPESFSGKDPDDLYT